MNGEGQNLSYFVRVMGFLATIIGAGVGTASLIWAYIAARRAQGAREAAQEATQAAARAARIAQLGDLIGDMQELQAMLARMDFAAIAGKANLLRGRIVRFKGEVYNELGEDEQESIDLARAQLQEIVEVALKSRAKDRSKVGRIQIGFGIAYEALNKVVAIQGRHAAGEHK